MKLTDNEKRDAIKYLQEGKPLPDKYRFLLFADDREVELVWNEKTQEVCNLTLPFQTIEHIDEPRTERIKSNKQDAFAFYDSSGRQIKGWTNIDRKNFRSWLRVLKLEPRKAFHNNRG